jgi:hypothetical protein
VDTVNGFPALDAIAAKRLEDLEVKRHIIYSELHRALDERRVALNAGSGSEVANINHRIAEAWANLAEVEAALQQARGSNI